MSVISCKELFNVATNYEHMKWPCSHGILEPSSKSKAFGVFLFVIAGLFTVGVLPLFYLAAAYKKIKALNENDNPQAQRVGAVAKPIVHAPLFKSLEIQDLEKILNETPALVNAVNEKGVPLIICAVETGKVDLVKWLLDKPGINVNAAIAKTRFTALQAACANPEIPLEILNLLLAKGGDPNLINANGRAAIHCSIDSKYIEGAKALIQHPSTNLELKDTQEGHFTPLSFAIYRFQYEIVEEIFKKEVDLKALDGQERNIFHNLFMSVSSPFTGKNGLEMVRLLLEKVPSATKKELFAAKDNSGKTPYEYALEAKELYINMWNEEEKGIPEKGKIRLAAISELIEEMKPLP